MKENRKVKPINGWQSLPIDSGISNQIVNRFLSTQCRVRLSMRRQSIALFVRAWGTMHHPLAPTTETKTYSILRSWIRRKLQKYSKISNTKTEIEREENYAMSLVDRFAYVYYKLYNSICIVLSDCICNDSEWAQQRRNFVRYIFFFIVAAISILPQIDWTASQIRIWNYYYFFSSSTWFALVCSYRRMRVCVSASEWGVSFFRMLFYAFTAIWERRFNGGSRQFFISLIGTGSDDHFTNVNETSSDTTPHSTHFILLFCSYTAHHIHDTPYERRTDFLFLLLFAFPLFLSPSLHLNQLNSILSVAPVQCDFSCVSNTLRCLIDGESRKKMNETK